MKKRSVESFINPLVCLLEQLHMLTLRAPALFASDFKSFFCRHTDSTHVKTLKLDILACIACDENAIDIAAELSEYVADVSPELAQHAVREEGNKKRCGY